jgi:hypothetical protein
LALVLVVSIILLTPLPSIISADSVPAWVIQTVDREVNGYNGYCPIVLDSNNNPHILYEGFDTQYAVWNGAGWNLSTIPQMEIPYDIVMDTNDNPHVLFRGLKGLMYATWTGFNWSIETVDESFWNGYGAITLDSSGNPHIAYTSRYTLNLIYRLNYGSKTGSNWNIQTLDESENIPYRTSIAVNENNVTYLMYGYTTKHNSGSGSYWDSQTVKLATKFGSNWSTQTAVSGITNYSHMVLDSKGLPHFAYQVQVREPLWTSNISYASWDGSTWKTQTVVTNVSLTVNFANINMGGLALDIHDYPHINYVASKDGSDLSSVVVYARWTGSQWDIQTVDSNHIANGEIYLSVDSRGYPYMSYLITPPGVGLPSRTANLMYATSTQPFPTTQTPTIFFQIQTIIAIVIVTGILIVIISIALYRRHRKTNN